MPELLPGDIVVMNNTKGNWYRKAIRFFTRQPWTHCAIVMGPVLDVACVFEADQVMTVTPVAYFVNDPATYNYEVYRIKDLPALDIRVCLRGLFQQSASTSYSYLQLLWFVWRWILESVSIKTTGMRNWFTEHMQCSEMVWNYLHALAEIHPAINRDIEPYNGNTTSPGDIRQILISDPDKYELIASGS